MKSDFNAKHYLTGQVFEGIDTTDLETFEKRSILFKAKKGENFNHRNTLRILRIKI